MPLTRAELLDLLQRVCRHYVAAMPPDADVPTAIQIMANALPDSPTADHLRALEFAAEEARAFDALDDAGEI